MTGTPQHCQTLFDGFAERPRFDYLHLPNVIIGIEVVAAEGSHDVHSPRLLVKNRPQCMRVVTQFKEPRFPRKSYKPEEIVAKLRQVDVLTSQGKNVAEAIRSIGISEVTYYRWRQEFGGLKSDQVKRLKDLETERTIDPLSILPEECAGQTHQSCSPSYIFLSSENSASAKGVFTSH
jgi:putative transposase